MQDDINDEAFDPNDNIGNINDYEYNKLKRLYPYNSNSTTSHLEVETLRNMNTIMIGAISEIESYFGHLWGHHKKHNELNDIEKVYKEQWFQLRNMLLNRGNAIKRKTKTLIRSQLKTIKINANNNNHNKDT
jgi:hypothetical protein